MSLKSQEAKIRYQNPPRTTTMATPVPTVVCRNPSVGVSQRNTTSLSQTAEDRQSGPAIRPARPLHQPCSGSGACSKYLDTRISAAGIHPALQRGTSGGHPERHPVNLCRNLILHSHLQDERRPFPSSVPVSGGALFCRSVLYQ